MAHPACNIFNADGKCELAQGGEGYRRHVRLTPIHVAFALAGTSPSSCSSRSSGFIDNGLDTALHIAHSHDGLGDILNVGAGGKLAAVLLCHTEVPRLEL